MNTKYLIGGVVLAVLIILVLQYSGQIQQWFSAEEPEDAVQQTTEPAITLPETPTIGESESVMTDPVVQQAPLPALDDSDPVVIVEVEEALGTGVFPGEWLSQEALLRRFAVVVDNAARGDYPRSQLGFLAPQGAFTVISGGSEDNRKYAIDPLSYRRYDALVATLETIPATSAAALIHRFEPLLQNALGELGNRTTFRDLLDDALQQVIGVPLLEEPVELVRPKVIYQFKDSSLEQRSALQKQLLRMGPDNIARLQSYAIELKAALQ